MALLAAQTIGVAGTVPTLTAAAASQTAKVAERTALLVTTAGTGTTLTLAAQAPNGNQPNGAAGTNTAFVIGTNAVAMIPINLAMYRNANMEVELSWSATTSVNVAVVTL